MYAEKTITLMRQRHLIFYHTGASTEETGEKKKEIMTTIFLSHISPPTAHRCVCIFLRLDPSFASWQPFPVFNKSPGKVMLTWLLQVWQPPPSHKKEILQTRNNNNKKKGDTFRKGRSAISRLERIWLCHAPGLGGGKIISKKTDLSCR